MKCRKTFGNELYYSIQLLENLLSLVTTLSQYAGRHMAIFLHTKMMDHFSQTRIVWKVDGQFMVNAEIIIRNIHTEKELWRSAESQAYETICVKHDQFEAERIIQQFEVERIVQQFEVERIIQRLWRGGEVKFIKYGMKMLNEKDANNSAIWGEVNNSAGWGGANDSTIWGEANN